MVYMNACFIECAASSWKHFLFVASTTHHIERWLAVLALTNDDFAGKRTSNFKQRSSLTLALRMIQQGHLLMLNSYPGGT